MRILLWNIQSTGCCKHMYSSSFSYWKRQAHEQGSNFFHVRWYTYFQLQTFSSSTMFTSVPTGAHCLPSSNLDNNFRQSICAIMQYWLQVDIIIFGVGLVKPVEYQAWSNATSKETLLMFLIRMWESINSPLAARKMRLTWPLPHWLCRLI